MSYDEIVALLKKRDDVKTIETTDQWIRQSHGITKHQLVRGSNGTACKKKERAVNKGKYKECDTFGKRFPAFKGATNEIMVALVGMPGDESAGSIWRRTGSKKARIQQLQA